MLRTSVNVLAILVALALCLTKKINQVLAFQLYYNQNQHIVFGQ
jgi:hypothetical protein